MLPRSNLERGPSAVVPLMLLALPRMFGTTGKGEAMVIGKPYVPTKICRQTLRPPVPFAKHRQVNNSQPPVGLSIPEGSQPDGLSTIKPSTIGLSTIKPSTIGLSTIKPSTIGLSTIKPSTIGLSTIGLSTSTIVPTTIKDPSTTLGPFDDPRDEFYLTTFAIPRDSLVARLIGSNVVPEVCAPKKEKENKAIEAMGLLSIDALRSCNSQDILRRVLLLVVLSVKNCHSDFTSGIFKSVLQEIQDIDVSLDESGAADDGFKTLWTCMHTLGNVANETKISSEAMEILRYLAEVFKFIILRLSVYFDSDRTFACEKFRQAAEKVKTFFVDIRKSTVTGPQVKEILRTFLRNISAMLDVVAMERPSTAMTFDEAAKTSLTRNSTVKSFGTFVVLQNPQSI